MERENAPGRVTDAAGRHRALTRQRPAEPYVTVHIPSLEARHNQTKRAESTQGTGRKKWDEGDEGSKKRSRGWDRAGKKSVALRCAARLVCLRE